MANRRVRGASVSGPPPFLNVAEGGEPAEEAMKAAPQPRPLPPLPVAAAAPPAAVVPPAGAVSRSRRQSVTGPPPFLNEPARETSQETSSESSSTRSSASEGELSASVAVATAPVAAAPKTPGYVVSNCAGEALAGKLAMRERKARPRSDTGVSPLWGKRVDLREICQRKMRAVELAGPSKYDADDMDDADFERIANQILSIEKKQLNHMKQCRDPDCSDGCMDLVEPVVRVALRLYEKFNRLESLETVCNEMARRADPKSKRKTLSSINAQEFGLKALVDSFLVEMLTTIYGMPDDLEAAASAAAALAGPETL